MKDLRNNYRIDEYSAKKQKQKHHLVIPNAPGADTLYSKNTCVQVYGLFIGHLNCSPSASVTNLHVYITNIVP